MNKFFNRLEIQNLISPKPRVISDIESLVEVRCKNVKLTLIHLRRDLQLYLLLRTRHTILDAIEQTFIAHTIL